MQKPDWPEGKLYYSPKGIYPFQLDGVTEVYFKNSACAVWDTGTGKSHLAMITSALLVEDDAIDLVLIVCERNKLSEWQEDFGKFTKLKAHIHHGPNRVTKLQRALARAEDNQDNAARIIISTYETIKQDCVEFVTVPGKRGISMKSNWLTEFLQQDRLMVVYDEVTKLGNRSSKTYKAHQYLLSHVRSRQPGLRVLGLSATPYESGWERSYNMFRLINPNLMPTITEFNQRYVRTRDNFGRALYHQNRIGEFAALCGSIISRKRKTDPDIRAQFPSMVEESRRVILPKEQQDFYNFCEELQHSEEEPVPGLFTVLRQVAGHPAALLKSDGQLAQLLVDEVGRESLLALPSGKTQELLAYLDQLVKGQGASVVVFTFFGQSILPLLAIELRNHDYKVFSHHGGLTNTEADRVKQEFREYPKPSIFLTSDAGSRGLNLPQASYVVEYESALTYANRVQRINRIHRIDSEYPSTTAMTFIAQGTIEERIIQLVVSRNSAHDMLVGDEEDDNSFSTRERKAMLQESRDILQLSEGQEW